MIAQRYGETVVRLTPATKTGRYSNASEIDWTQPPTETPIRPVVVVPSMSLETRTPDSNPVTTTLYLYCPVGTTVERHERIRVRGDVYEIAGDPAVWPRGVVITVTRSEG